MYFYFCAVPYLSENMEQTEKENVCFHIHPPP